MSTEVEAEGLEESGTSERSALRPGELLAAGRYRIVELLAEGGMGLVYVATQEPMGRKVALKVMKQELVSDQASVKRFFREAVAVSKLHHPNTITIIDYGEAEGKQLFIAMEFLDGEPLSKVIKREGSLSLRRAVNVVGQITRALAEAHEKGVIHRDMKPENVFISKVDGGEDYVKVLDFGIAKLQQQADGATKITRLGYVCGTPEYMSPEQARGEEINGGTDLYALGVMLWEMLEGATPFDAPTPLGIVLKHQTAEIPPMQSNVPAAFKRFVYRAMAKDRADRPGSAEEFLKEMLEACPPDLDAYSVASIGATGRRPRTSDELGPTVDIAYTPTLPDGPEATSGEVVVAGRSRAPLVLGAAAVLAVLCVAGVVVAAVMSGQDAEGGIDTALPTPEAPSSAPVLVIDGQPPGAEVYQDGALLGKAPLEYPGEPGGVVRFELRKAGFAPRTLERTLPESGRVEIAYTLIEESSPRVEITLDSDPSGAKIMQGEAIVGTTPHSFTLAEGAAPFEVSLVLDRYQPAVARIDASLGSQNVRVPLAGEKVRAVARRGEGGKVVAQGNGRPGDAKAGGQGGAPAGEVKDKGGDKGGGSPYKTVD